LTIQFGLGAYLDFIIVANCTKKLSKILSSAYCCREKRN